MYVFLVWNVFTHTVNTEINSHVREWEETLLTQLTTTLLGNMTIDEFIDGHNVGPVHVCRVLFSNMHITSPLTGLLLWNERGRLHAKRRFLVIAPLNYAHGHAYASAFNRLTRFMCVPPVCHIQIFPWISTWEARCAGRQAASVQTCINITSLHLVYVIAPLTPQRVMCRLLTSKRLLIITSGTCLLSMLMTTTVYLSCFYSNSLSKYI